jgi:hypothetical protein
MQWLVNLWLWMILWSPGLTVGLSLYMNSFPLLLLLEDLASHQVLVVAVACESNTGGWLKDLILWMPLCVLFYLFMLVSEAWLPFPDNRHDLPDAVVIGCILCTIWMETNMCWHLLWCMNSLGVMICLSCGFSVWLGSCGDPSTAWCASKGCSYLLCMLLSNITGSQSWAFSIFDVEMKIDI